MPRSARPPRRSGRGDQGSGSKDLLAQKPNRAVKRKRRSTHEEDEADNEELFKVEKIVASKRDKNGAPLYKTRWKGYSAGEDTWEPSENLASTGHIDRFERQQRQRTLSEGTAGVAVIEYEDGEREMVDMQMEKFRGYSPDSDQRDSSECGDEYVNDFDLLGISEWIEILWKHTKMYFPCQIIHWTPLRSTKSRKNSTGNSSSNLMRSPPVSSPQVLETSGPIDTNKRAKRGDDIKKEKKTQMLGELEESVVPNGLKDIKQTSARAKHGGDIMKDKSSEPVRMGSQEEDPDSDDIKSESSGLSYDVASHSDRPVEKIGQGIPLFDEPEDDFDSSDESDESDEENGSNSGPYPSLHEVPTLTFEELWTLKLKRTQELMDRGTNSGHTGDFCL